MENPIPASLVRPPLKRIIFKRKNGKKESRNKVSGYRMRSAISPEGRAKGNEGRYAHAADAGHYLGCPFSPFRMKTSTIIP